ncbi:hypothetical protein Q6D67_13800 [Haliea sp. E1-2-M8]|uniref:hypothetical protein n=1 Tax=Haliea sp. E1-2-M8 TaxID=3064706 RepID=UPI0027263467|nr:hypothetical protein [Haliea sp. E1-2-M8]MDO8862779.1 hypothetical protein [Haliea sp. E1-2-M8]
MTLPFLFGPDDERWQRHMQLLPGCALLPRGGHKPLQHLTYFVCQLGLLLALVLESGMGRVIVAILIFAASAALLWYVFLARPAEISAPSAPVPAAVPEISRDTDWYPRRNWQQNSPGNMNISVFAYRDRNRDGVLDPDDVPMAAVAILLERPDGSLRMTRTNINGYANFAVHLDSSSADIGEPDRDYRFELQLPPGWEITSGTGSHTTRFEKRPGTPAGMVTASPPPVIGLAQLLAVSGSQAVGADALVAVAPDGSRSAVVADAAGRFSFPAYPGDWRLEQAAGSAGAGLHQFAVRDAPVVLGAINDARAATTPQPAPLVLDFDDLERSVIEKLAVGYRGLAFDYLLAIDNQHYRGPGYVNVLASGEGVAYNSSGYPATVTSLYPGEVFDFVGAYFGVAWEQAEGETLVVEGWRAGRQMYRDELPLSHLGPVWLQADYRGIDELRLHTLHYWQFTADDMAFRLPQGQ